MSYKSVFEDFFCYLYEPAYAYICDCIYKLYDLTCLLYSLSYFYVFQKLQIFIRKNLSGT